MHTALFANALIPHPFIGNNEKELQWIEDEHWVYETTFSLTEEELNFNHIELEFKGLDTYAHAYLNGKEILEANNAFRRWKIQIKDILKKENELRVEFIPTSVIESKKAKEIPYELPEGPRVFTRKAQFQYGWDWGPRYNTMGIWRPVYLEFWNDLKIEDVYVKQNFISENIAELEIETRIKTDTSSQITAELSVNGLPEISQTYELKKGENILKLPLSIDSPKLWQPNGLGEQYLYDFKLALKDNSGIILDEKEVRTGLRTIELVNEKDVFGESFYFKVNGKPVFMKGANYIPQNSFQDWVQKEDYEKLLTEVRDSNMNMLRIWGGGIYEEDYFYELCDELGILVWQDFMFGNGMYPGDEEFLKNVTEEAKENIIRLRNHPSLALWCGNNEISEGWHRWGWQDGRSEEEKEEIWENYQKLFNGILPDAVSQYSNLPYWESSPKYGRGDSRYISEGDAHDWWIWHDGHPFEDLESKTPRFMSEFGFQSFPSLEAIRFINEGKSTSIYTEEFANHEKHPRGFEIIRTYMDRDFPIPENEEGYVYMSQLVQAYGIGKGIEAQRRNKPYTMGSLYWQLNDCWPVASWSGIDFFGNWKPLQYQVQKSFKDVLVSFEREGEIVKVFIVNDRPMELTEELILSVLDFDGNKLIEKKLFPKVLPNSSEVYATLDLNEFKGRENQIVIRAGFDSEEFYYYLVRPKELKLKPSQLKFKIEEQKEKTRITLNSNTLERYVQVNYDEKPIYYVSEIQAGKDYSFEVDTFEFDSGKLEIKVLNNFLLW